MTIKEKTIQKEMKTIGGSSDPDDFDNTIGIYNGKNPPLYPALEYMPGDPKDAISVSGSVVTAKIRKPKQGQPIIFKLRTSGPVYRRVVFGAFFDSFSWGTNYVFVWDPGSNAYATDIPKDGGGFATFPCEFSDIRTWYGLTTAPGADLYSGSSCGHSALEGATGSGNDSCAEPDGTEPGQAWNASKTGYNCSGTGIVLSDDMYNAWQGSGGPLSSEVTMNNNVSGKSSKMVKYEYKSEYFCDNIASGVCPDSYHKREDSEYAKYTLRDIWGELGNFELNFARYNKSGHCENGASCVSSGERSERHIEFQTFGGNKEFDTHIMFQVTIAEAFQRYKHWPQGYDDYSFGGVQTLWPCPLPDGCYRYPCTSGASGDIEQHWQDLLIFNVHASCEYLADTDGVDPRLRSRNTPFENAITATHTDYITAKGGNSSYSFTTSIREFEV